MQQAGSDEKRRWQLKKIHRKLAKFLWINIFLASKSYGLIFNKEIVHGIPKQFALLGNYAV
jgi:hypothetical protein